MNKRPSDEKLDDSIRNVILCYCCHTYSHGSLTVKKASKGKIFAIPDLPKDELWNTFESEFRNISEIFVHVLDLHYFYAGRVSIYIPLIWCSWIAVPHINGDIRQYVLRSLLAIASKEDGDVFTRFNSSISRFVDILRKYEKDKLNFPIIPEIIANLDNKDKAYQLYFTAFKASLIIVDLYGPI